MHELQCNGSVFPRPFRVWTPRHTGKPVPSLIRLSETSRNCSDDEENNMMVRLADIDNRHRAGNECGWRWVCRAVDSPNVYPATWWQAEAISNDCSGGAGHCKPNEVQLAFLLRQDCRNKWLWYYHTVPVAFTCQPTLAEGRKNPNGLLQPSAEVV